MMHYRHDSDIVHKRDGTDTHKSQYQYEYVTFMYYVTIMSIMHHLIHVVIISSRPMARAPDKLLRALGIRSPSLDDGASKPNLSRGLTVVSMSRSHHSHGF